MHVTEDPLAPPPELRKLAFAELGETDRLRRESLAALKQRIESYRASPASWRPKARRGGGCCVQNRGGPCDFRVRDDLFLLAFLRCKKFDVDEAFQKLLNYSLFLEAHPHWLEDEIDEGLCRAMLGSGATAVMPWRDGQGRRIMTLSPRNMEVFLAQTAGALAPAEQVAQFTRAGFWVMNSLIRDVETQISGVIMVESLEGFSLKFLKWCDNKKECEQAMHLFMGCYPFRLRAFYILREPWFLSLVWFIMKAFLPRKLKERVDVFGNDTEALFQKVSKDLLPVEFGGTLLLDLSLEASKWIEIMKRTRSEFLAMRKS